MLINLFFLIFMLGASFASFISVYIERGKDDRFFSSKNKSICANCLRKLNYFELIPVFSFIFLRGKCRVCKTKIPTKLFIGEIILGLWFLGSFLFFLELEYGKIYFALSCLMGSIFYFLALEDYENMEVSTTFVYLFVALGIFTSISKFILTGNYFAVFVPLLIISPFWLIYIVNKNYIGQADPYIYTALGLFFGTQFALSLFLYSVWIGAAFGIFYLKFINKKFERGIRIPFLPIIFIASIFILITNFHIIKIQDILFINEFFFHK